MKDCGFNFNAVKKLLEALSMKWCLDILTWQLKLAPCPEPGRHKVFQMTWRMSYMKIFAKMCCTSILILDFFFKEDLFIQILSFHYTAFFCVKLEKCCNFNWFFFHTKFCMQCCEQALVYASYNFGIDLLYLFTDKFIPYNNNFKIWGPFGS